MQMQGIYQEYGSFNKLNSMKLNLKLKKYKYNATQTIGT